MRMYQDASLPTANVAPWAERYATRNSDRADIWRGRLDAADIRRARQGYYGSVSFVDEQIGRILEALEKRGWLDETLIVFTSDHGDMLGDHNLWRKSYAYEPSARIPMLLRWPAAGRGKVADRVVELRDLLPTFLDVAGSPPSRPLDGRSLLAGARGAEWRDFLDLEHDLCYSPENHWNALTDGRWKFIFHAFDGREQLFRLETDPHEMRDLAGDPSHEPDLRRWRQRLVEHLAERGDQWVKAGKLALRPKSQQYSPNYPRA
jgi:arylsulfatase A-like enzyme